jgi:hypothetical protein
MLQQERVARALGGGKTAANGSTHWVTSSSESFFSTVVFPALSSPSTRMRASRSDLRSLRRRESKPIATEMNSGRGTPTTELIPQSRVARVEWRTLQKVPPALEWRLPSPTKSSPAACRRRKCMLPVLPRQGAPRSPLHGGSWSRRPSSPGSLFNPSQWAFRCSGLPWAMPLTRAPSVCTLRSGSRTSFASWRLWML